MGSIRTGSTTPDLFSPTSVKEPSSPSANATSPTNAITSSPKANSLQRHILPSDLTTAIKQLEDGELDRLLSAVLAEQKRRGRKNPVSDERSRKRRVEAVTVSLKPGKLNAVRAAFKAGLTPSRIARQFGISQSDVRKALASEPKR